MTCPFCLHDSIEGALVCVRCSRDIAVPASLIAERDDLLRKCDHTRDELSKARAELDRLKPRRQP
jgi:hypothetical protein